VRNRIFERDDMFCSENGTTYSRCNTATRTGNVIEVRYCCADPYCNANNTYLFEFIKGELGMVFSTNVLKPHHQCNNITSICFVVWYVDRSFASQRVLLKTINCA